MRRAKEIAKTSNSIRKKYRALKTKIDKGHRIGETLQIYYRSAETDYRKQLNPARISWLKRSFREKTKNQNLKENDQVLCTTFLLTGFHVCKISVESIENRIVHFERNNTATRVIIQPRSFYRRNFRDCQWTARNIYSNICFKYLRGKKSMQTTGPLEQKYLKAVRKSLT